MRCRTQLALSPSPCELGTRCRWFAPIASGPTNHSHSRFSHGTAPTLACSQAMLCHATHQLVRDCISQLYSDLTMFSSTPDRFEVHFLCSSSFPLTNKLLPFHSQLHMSSFVLFYHKQDLKWRTFWFARFLLKRNCLLLFLSAFHFWSSAHTRDCDRFLGYSSEHGNSGTTEFGSYNWSKDLNRKSSIHRSE